MKAVVKPGPYKGLKYVEDYPYPQYKENEVVVAVKAAGICGSDLHIYEWTDSYSWMPLPVIIGHEFAGQVVEVGKAVTRVKVGDRVVCRPVFPCGKCIMCKEGHANKCLNFAATGGSLGLRRDGGFAEYCAATEDHCVLMPDDFPYELGAMVEPLGIAANAVNDSQMVFGDNVCIFGPGTIGLLTLVCAKHRGAAKIIVCGTKKDAARMEMAKRLGATHLFYADSVDPVEEVRAITDGLGVDVAFEATGYPPVIQQGLSLVKPTGKMVTIGIHSRPAEIDCTAMVRGAKQLIGSYGGIVAWERLINMLASSI